MILHYKSGHTCIIPSVSLFLFFCLLFNFTTNLKTFISVHSMVWRERYKNTQLENPSSCSNTFPTANSMFLKQCLPSLWRNQLLFQEQRRFGVKGVKSRDNAIAKEIPPSFIHDPHPHFSCLSLCKLSYSLPAAVCGEHDVHSGVLRQRLVFAAFPLW